jgi:hypothetical protein
MEAFLSTFSTVSVLKFWTVKVAGTWFSLSCNTDANDRDADIFSCETKSWSEIVLFLVSSRGVLPNVHITVGVQILKPLFRKDSPAE